MEKLVDVFNTRYFAAHWEQEVSAYLKTHSEVDLAGAKIAADVMRVITTKLQSDPLAYFRDTEDPDRDRILKENRSRSALTYKTTQLALPASAKEVPDYINNLSTGLVYTIPPVRREVYIPLVVLIQAYYPEIKIDMEYSYEVLFKYIASKLYPSTYRWKKFYMLTWSTFDTIEMQEDGTFRIPFDGNLDYDTFLNRNVVVPYEFGLEWLDDKQEWSAFIDAVVADLEEQLTPKTHSLKDYM